MGKIKKVNIHAGHGLDGKAGCGSVGLIKESTEARYLVGKIVNKLKEQGIEVHDCTVNNGTGQRDILEKIVRKCNANDVDLDISIHFNSGRNDRKGDGKTGGVEVWMRTDEGIKKTIGRKICNKLENLGFTNRGIKTTKSLYFLNHTKAPAILIEICFVDDKDDTKLYKQVKNKIAEKICNLIINY